MQDRLNRMLAKAIASDIDKTGRCSLRKLLARLGYRRNRLETEDWPMIRQMVEKLLRSQKGLNHDFKLINAQELFLDWLDSSRQQNFKRDGVVLHPDRHPEKFCPVNKMPEAFIRIDLITPGMASYLGQSRENHITGRIDTALDMQNTAIEQGVSLPQLDPHRLSATVTARIAAKTPPPPPPSLPPKTP
jgi:hypothetical protein